MDGNPRRNGIPVANGSHHDGQPSSKLIRVILKNMNSNRLSWRNVGSLIWHINKDVFVPRLGSILAQFDKLFSLLGMKDTKQYTDKFITSAKVVPVLADYVKQDVAAEDVSDLAD